MNAEPEFVYTPECEAWLRSLGLQLMDLAMHRLEEGAECPAPIETAVWRIVKAWCAQRPHHFVITPPTHAPT